MLAWIILFVYYAGAPVVSCAKCKQSADVNSCVQALGQWWHFACFV